MPIISVIIPAYNAERTLKQTIESVLKQTFSDWELIVINDGSQDATLEIVSHISDARVKVFSYSNAGVSASRNRGIAKATGELIAFLDADDLWTPDKLETGFQALQANPQAAVAYSWTDYIDESGQFFRAGNHVTETGNVYAKLLLGNFLENGSNALVRKQALTEVGGFDESLSGPEDWEIYLRLAERYEFVIVPSPQVLYRLSPHAASSNIEKMEKENLKVIERVFSRVPESLQFLKSQTLANLYNYLASRTLEATPKPDKYRVAFQLINHYAQQESSMQARLLFALTVLFKNAMFITFGAKNAQNIIISLKSSLRKSKEP